MAKAEPKAEPVLMKRKAQQAVTLLSAAGLSGFDPAAIIALILSILKAFDICDLSPQKALQRVKALAAGRWYLGIALDRLTLRRKIRESECCRYDGDCPCSPEDVEAVVLDMAAGLTLADMQALYAEAE